MIKPETEALRKLAEILPVLTSVNLVKWQRHEDGSLQGDLTLTLKNIPGKAVRLRMLQTTSGKASADIKGQEIEQLFQTHKNAPRFRHPGTLSAYADLIRERTELVFKKTGYSNRGRLRLPTQAAKA